MGLYEVKGSKSDYLQAKRSSKTFCTNQLHFKIWCVVKIFIRNVTRSKNFDSKFPQLWKSGPKSDAFKILDSKYDALYIKRSKNWLSSKIFIQYFFMKEKNTFFRHNFSKNAQKRQHWSFYGLNWRAKWVFESEFYSNICFF